MNRKNQQIEVEAERFFGLDPLPSIERLVGGDAEYRYGRLVVAAPGGTLEVEDGEWVVKFGDDEFDVVSNEYFNEHFREI